MQPPATVGDSNLAHVLLGFWARGAKPPATKGPSMIGIVKALAAAVTFCAATAAASLANVITFEAAPTSGVFYIPIDEDGFRYSPGGWGYVWTGRGNPGKGMAGVGFDHGGRLVITALGNRDFTFESVDFAAYDASGAGSQKLLVVGFLDGVVVGAEQYTLANTSVFLPTFGNWTTETASGLAGRTLDLLQFVLPAGFYPSNHMVTIDNVVLTPGAVETPEPSSLFLIAAGLAGLRIARRRRRPRSSPGRSADAR